MVKILVNIIRDLSSRLKLKIWQLTSESSNSPAMPDQPRGGRKKDRDFAFQTLLFEAEFSRPSIIVRNFEVYIQNLNAT